MLMDYHNELKVEVAKERTSEVERLIESKAETHNEIVGRINAYDTALDLIDEVLKRFSEDADEAPREIVRGRLGPKPQAELPRYRRHA